MLVLLGLGLTLDHWPRTGRLPETLGLIGLGLAFAIPACWPGRPKWALITLLVMGSLGLLATALATVNGGCCCAILGLPVFGTITLGAIRGLNEPAQPGLRQRGFEVELAQRAEPAEPLGAEPQDSDSDRPK